MRLARSPVDIAAMMELGRLLHAENRFHDLPLDDGRIAEIGRHGLEGGNLGLFAEHDGVAVGMAMVQLLYVSPQARGGVAAVRLLRAVCRWAERNGALDLHVNVTTGIDAARTDRFLRHMGFRQTGGNYVLEGIG